MGISSAKAKIARKTGIPTTRAGRQRKAGAALGCCVLLALPAASLVAALLFATR